MFRLNMNSNFFTKLSIIFTWQTDTKLQLLSIYNPHFRHETYTFRWLPGKLIADHPRVDYFRRKPECGRRFLPHRTSGIRRLASRTWINMSCHFYVSFRSFHRALTKGKLEWTRKVRYTSALDTSTRRKHSVVQFKSRNVLLNCCLQIEEQTASTMRDSLKVASLLLIKCSLIICWRRWRERRSNLLSGTGKRNEFWNKHVFWSHHA